MASAAATFTTYIAAKNKKTLAVTATKGVKRKAHTPTVVRINGTICEGILHSLLFLCYLSFVESQLAFELCFKTCKLL